jgi:hypothetical protein
MKDTIATSQGKGHVIAKVEVEGSNRFAARNKTSVLREAKARRRITVNTQ